MVGNFSLSINSQILKGLGHHVDLNYFEKKL
jgi:hypothetical protein